METGVLTSSRRATARGFRTFLVIWAGQLVSLVGSGLTGFALGVWVYQRTGSVTQFALISLSTALPGILFSPIAGALVDRWDRRWAMILSDAGAGLCTLTMAVLLLLNRLQVWHIYLAMAASAANFVVGIVGVLFTPLVLSFTTTAVLGLLLSVGGGGFLTGSLAMSIWGGPKRRVYGVLGFNLLLGTVLFAAGFPPRAWILGLAAFLAYFSLPMINGCSQAIWQSKVAPDIQGRVFAVRRMVAWASLPLAYLAAGPLADRVFEPLMAEGSPLAGNVGRVIGVGVGRGIGLLYILLGFLLLLATAAAYLYPRLREVERELPDVVVEEGR